MAPHEPACKHCSAQSRKQLLAVTITDGANQRFNTLVGNTCR
jgi:hypothetical protein